MKADHSITKGYPYDTIISQERFKVRPYVILDHKDKRKTKFWVDKGTFTDYKPATWLQRKIAGKLIDFLEFRIFDYAEALYVAETQITHLQEEQPFLPEDFGFIKTVGPVEIHDNPVKIYTSRYNDTISLFRNDEQECEWILLKRVNGTFQDTKLQIPNHRIAYAAFLALGIKVENDKTEEENQDMRDSKSEMKEFRADYSDGVDDGIRAWINLKAYDEEDARSRAKFIFETGDFGIKEPIKFSEVSITNN
jgi:hypothetical protein